MLEKEVKQLVDDLPLGKEMQKRYVTDAIQVLLSKAETKGFMDGMKRAEEIHSKTIGWVNDLITKNK